MSYKTASGVAIGVLLLLCAYLGYQNSQLKKVKNQTQSDLSEMQKVHQELETDYQTALQSIEGLRSDNQEMNALIESQKQELLAQKTKVNNLIWTKRELDKARIEITKFVDLTKNNVAELEALKAANAKLTAQNVELTTNVTNLTQDLTSEKQMTTELTATKNTLISEKTDLTNKNTNLQKKVAIGSAIKINWMSFNGGDINDKEEFKSRKRSKKMDVLRTCFRTESNPVVLPGSEEFMIRIINVNGETLAAEDLGSGVLEDNMTGKSVKYTMKGNIEYANKDTEACMDWNPNFEVPKGEYTVEIYNKGYKVGSGKFKI